MIALWQRLRFWACLVLRDGLALYIAARHPRTPWFAKLFALLVAAYALSPIDLIPAEIMAESRAAAQSMLEKPRSKAGAAIIISIWVLALGGLGAWAFTRWGSSA